MNKRNKNKGFTLVELIVVIVILAILVGVTLGGIYQYVNKARVNTDIKNANTIQRLAQTAYMNNELDTRYFSKPKNGDEVCNRNSGVNNGCAVLAVHWNLGGGWTSHYKWDNFRGTIWCSDRNYDVTFINNKTWSNFGYTDSTRSSGTMNLVTYYLYKSGLIQELPKSQSNSNFWLLYYWNEDGTLKKIICKVADSSKSVWTVIRENE